MTAVLANVMVVASLAGPAADSAGAAAVAQWHALLPGVKTLEVAFDLVKDDRSAGKTFRYDGRFHLVRTADGPLADYALTRDGKPDGGGLLHGGRAYELDAVRKSANRFHVTAGDHAGFLARNFHPLALLTDPARVGAYHVRAVGADEHYTFLHVTSTPAARRDGVHSVVATVAVFKRAAGGFPAGAPAVIRHADGFGQPVTTYRLRSWNTSDGPTAADFVRPEDRPGWTVTDYTKLWPTPRKRD